jgi:MFS family permease
VFGHAPFAIFWFAGLLSNSGTWLQTIAASVVMYSVTESAFMVGVLNFVGLLPLAVFSVMGGVVSDRHDRRLVVVATSIGGMVVGLALSAVALVDTGNDVMQLALIVGTFLSSACYAFAKPALAALVPALVPRDQLRPAIAYNSLQYTGGQLIGAVATTVVLTFAGAALAFATNAATFIGLILAMAVVPNGQEERTSADDSGGILPAARYVRGDPRLLVALAGVGLGSAGYEATRTLSPVLAATAYGSTEEVAGIIVGLASFGSAIGTLAVGVFSHRIPLRSGVLTGAAMMALAPSLPLALAGSALTGLAFALSFTLLTALVQDVVPDGLRGRVMSFHMLAHLGSRPFVALLIGASAAAFGGRLAVAAMATMLVVVAAWTFRLGVLRPRAAHDVPAVPAAGR